MTAPVAQPPLFTDGGRQYSPDTEAAELRVRILDHYATVLRRGAEVPGTRCPGCAAGLKAVVCPGAPGARSAAVYAYCLSCLWWAEL